MVANRLNVSNSTEGDVSDNALCRNQRGVTNYSLLHITVIVVLCVKVE